MFSLLLPTIFISVCLANIIEESESTEVEKPKIERHFVFETIPMNLKEIVDASGIIFTGNCTSSEDIENDVESKLPVIKYTFKITECIKGECNKEITFKQWQPTTKSTNYEVGKKYVLFLYPKSERGLTSPVALEQGSFEITKKGLIKRKEVVRNKLNNRGLNRNLKTQKTISIDKDKYINEYVNRCSELGIPMRYQEFIKAVRYLLEE